MAIMDSSSSSVRVEVVAVPVSLAGLLVLVLVALGCGICVRRKRGVSERYETAMAINAVSTAGDATRTSAMSNPITEISHDYSLPIDVPIDMSENGDSYSYARSSGMYMPPGGEGQTKQASSTNVRRFAERDYEVPATDKRMLFEQILEIFKVEELQRHVIKFGRTLGEGNFGTVWQGEMVNSKGVLKKVAVKALKEGSVEEDRVKFLQEAVIMVQFRHPNVIKVHGVVTVDDPVLIVLELLTNGDLCNYLTRERMKEPMKIDDHTLLSFCRQIVAGMVYLSNKSFVHRDLAARNILLSQYGICKIADFGLSRDLMDEVYYVSRGGKIPVKWTAPEALHYKKYSAASDVWSYGIVMYEIWSLGRKPYEGLGIHELIRTIDMGYRMPPPSGCPRAIYETMISAWHPTTAQRPLFEDLAEKLSMPDTLLLEWSEADGPPSRLGKMNTDTSELYQELQYLYSAVPY